MIPKDIKHAMMMAYMNKTLYKYCEGLHIQIKGLKNVKSLINSSDKVIFVAPYRSFTDLFLILYSLQMEGIEIPFSFGGPIAAP